MTFRYHSSLVRRVGCDGRKALLLLDRDDELYGIAGHGLTGQAPAWASCSSEKMRRSSGVTGNVPWTTRTRHLPHMPLPPQGRASAVP